MAMGAPRGARLAWLCLLLLCLLGSATPSPKGEGSTTVRSTEKKRAAPGPAKKKVGATHSTVPRSRLHSTLPSAAAAPAKPSVQGKPKAAAEPKPAGEGAAPGGAKQPAAEEGDLSSSERAALIGGLLLAPAGIGGFLLGSALGGGSVLLYEKVSKGVQSALVDFKAKNQPQEIEGGFRSFEQYLQLNEITCKAPTEELAEAYRQRLSAVLEHPHNRRCFDCTHVEPEMAVWASVNLGVFVCERCAGMHRALGTHKSRIKSAYADVWTKEMIERMEGLGNEKCRELYGEAGKVRVDKDVDTEVLEVHVRDKYSKIKQAPGPIPGASGKLYRCETSGTAAEGAAEAPAAEGLKAASNPEPAVVLSPAPKPKAAKTATGAKPKKALSSSSKVKSSKLSSGSKGPKAKKATATAAR
ncbi:putative GTPase activating protein for Arf-domain-containing protein [Pavlovales sp. CCMP2436]|nr:putative GTPase activating protein for Arf-domain-containing protein [Pavlovales sp. CCMP2436]